MRPANVALHLIRLLQPGIDPEALKRKQTGCCVQIRNGAERLSDLVQAAVWGLQAGCGRGGLKDRSKMRPARIERGT